jgi:hypothetical protein
MVLMECLGGLRRGKVKDDTGLWRFFLKSWQKQEASNWKNRRERNGGKGRV